ncbi:MAG: DUF1553 domain-containing protein [Pirellulales bacterium]
MMGWISGLSIGCWRLGPAIQIVRILFLVVGFTLTLEAQDWQVEPERLELHGNFAQLQLLIRECDAAGNVTPRSVDLTSLATCESLSTGVVQVQPGGRLRASGNGTAELRVTLNGVTRVMQVAVDGVVDQPELEFTEHVEPVLYKLGCNSGACHASQYGKGGFTLSVMGFDPPADHAAMALGSRGRRLSPANAQASLVLQKATAEIPHGGGPRMDRDSVPYQLLTAWISQGALPPKADPRRVTKLTVTPTSRVGKVGSHQQLRVVASYADGLTRDVTAWARFDSMDEAVVRVDGQGIATTVGPGQAAILIRFADQADICTMMVPFSDAADLAQWKQNNFVDELAAKKFLELGITPSPLCDDATFLRRIFLDATGGLPSPEEVEQFLQSTDPAKRDEWIDRVLGLTGDPARDKYNDRYAAYWSLKWSDLIRNNSTVVGESGMWAFHNWLVESFRVNKPFDLLVRELITAKGSAFSNGPANFYRIATNPSDLAESTSQLFLGTRLQCAKCHHHPYEKYSQADYYGFAAFFARVGSKGSSEFGNFGGESVVMVTSGGEVTHPKSGAVMKPTPLNGQPVAETADRRIQLADWLTSTDNVWFARNIVNRYVAYLLGRGLVEPVDDLRSTNPPSNVELMDGLSRDLVASHFNIKQLMRTIMRSTLYQLDSQPTEANQADQRFYSHYRVKRLAAEPLLDCIDVATGVATKHPNLPLGTKAIELPDGNTTSPFLMTFGKPKRASVCECERTPDENLSQALHMLNGEIVATKIADAQGRVARLVDAKKPVDDALRELYLATVSRPPTAAELEYLRQAVAESPSPAEAYQDVLWALVNSKQFLFVR